MTIVKVRVDISDALSELVSAQKQVVFAHAVALTKTGQAVKAAERAEMKSVFKSVVSFTLNSLYLKSASRSNLIATVGVKDQSETTALKWLSPEIEGGNRGFGIEAFLRPANLPPSGLYAVPGSAAPMAGGGKINISALKSIVSQLKSQPAGAQGFVSIKRKGRRSKKAQYFYLERPMYGLPAGIFGVKGREVLPIILFVKRPSYRAKYDFYGVATKTAEAVFPQAFNTALANALATAR